MKLFIALAALVAVSTAYPGTHAPDPDFIKDLGDFLNCINVNGLISDVTQFANTDAEVQHILDYITTDTFKNYVRAINKEPTYLAILTDLDNYEVPAYQGVNRMLELLGIEKIVPPTMGSQKRSGLRSFQDLIDKVEMDDIDVQCVEDTYNDKINAKGDTVFKKVDKHLHSDDFAKLVNAFKQSDALVSAKAAFLKEGLNLDSLIQLFKTIFHWDW